MARQKRAFNGQKIQQTCTRADNPTSDETRLDTSRCTIEFVRSSWAISRITRLQEGEKEHEEGEEKTDSCWGEELDGQVIE